jgi:hypothetical protein
MIQKRGSEFDEGKREVEEWNVSAMHRKPAMSLGRCGRILTLGGGNDGEREGDDARLRAARVWIMLGVTDGGGRPGDYTGRWNCAHNPRGR